MRADPLILIIVAALSLAACARHPTDLSSRADLPPTRCLPARAAPMPAPSTGGMVFIKGGSFAMGAKPMRREEGPERPTRVGAFWIDRTDVTNADFARF